MKKILSVLLVAALLLGLCACGAAKPVETTAPTTEANTAPTTQATEPPTEPPTEPEPVPVDPVANLAGTTATRVDAVTVADRTCYMYVPESNRVGNFLGLTPIITVFGDEPFADEAAVMKAAEEGGFAEIAQRDGLCILFLNPVESWDSDADKAAAADLYAGIYDQYSSMPNLQFEEGKAHLVVRDQEGNVTDERDVYPGSLHGFQMFGAGKGADYIAANYTVPNTYNGSYAMQVFPGLTGIPSGICLVNPSVLTECTDGAVIPMAIVNGPENAQTVADSFNVGAGESVVLRKEGVTGFEKDLTVRLYDEVVSKYYYSQGQFRENPKYREKGIIETTDWVNLNEETKIEYYAYIPDDIDFASEKTVPCMFWMHGFGGEGEAMLSWTEWPLIGKEEGFMVVSLDQHTNFAYTAEMFMNAIDEIIAKYPFIDTGRIYLGGFSFGSYHTWKTALCYSDRFAAIVPDALGLFALDPIIEAAIPNGKTLPTFYIAGGQSAMELGSSEMTQSALKVLWQLNKLGEYTYDEAYEWGVPADEVRTVSYKDHADEVLDVNQRQQYLSISSFVSEDGNTYTWLAVNRNKPHTITNNDAHIVWEYIKNFYRDANGDIQIMGK